MSDDVADVLEEHERNEIRGTLIGVSRANTRVAQRSVDIVDPYAGGAAVGEGQHDNTRDKTVMQERLGMAPMTESDKRMCLRSSTVPSTAGLSLK